MPRGRGPTPPKPRPQPGFPKVLVCLLCGRPRVAMGPADRLHPRCRKAVVEADRDAGPGLSGL